MIQPEIEQALLSRRSVRGYLRREVPDELVRRILALAARAPSGSNLQPWRVHVLRGEARTAFSAALRRAAAGEGGPHEEEYAYYPRIWREPYLARRRKLGYALYGLLGIERGDKLRMDSQHARNYDFFGAPVGLIFTIDRELEQGSWLDYGTFLQSVMIAARGAGLDSCAQQSFARFHGLIRQLLAIPAGQVVVCGMALGWADPAERANQLRTERMPLPEFVIVHDQVTAPVPAQEGLQ